MLIFFATTIKSQDYHFIYIQSENKQPFYLRTKEKVYSSTESGYLIIPKLESKRLIFTVGFPKNIWPPSDYQLDIELKDLGFQLKKVDSLQWALYDLQTSELLSPTEKNANKFQIIQTSTDEFSNILAEVSNNPAIKQKKINTDEGLVENKNYNSLIVDKSTSANPDEKIISSTSDTALQSSLTKTVETIIPKMDTAVQLSIAKAEEPIISKADTAVQLNIVKNDETIIPKMDTAVQLNIAKNDETIIPKMDTSVQLNIAKNDETIIPKMDTAVQLSIAKTEEPIISKADTVVQLNTTKTIESAISKTETVPLVLANSADNYVVPQLDSINKIDVANKVELPVSIIDSVDHQISSVSIKKDTALMSVEISKQTVNRIETKSITRELSFIDSSGRSLTYTIKEEGIEDHVVIFISYDKPLVFPKLENDTNVDVKINIQNVAQGNDQKEFSTASNCITLANDEDFLLLRREMVAAESELKMIDIAMNSLVKKCWKVDQIKNLAVLLLNDDNRFEFIKMSKTFLVDQQQFVNMLPLMTTEKNINNFKALLN
jgi:hypothetical protein